MHRRLGTLLLTVGATTSASTSALAQHISDYAGQIPLHLPAMLARTDASRKFCLWGFADGDELDSVREQCPPAPVGDTNGNGIEDGRGAILKALAVAFSPILYRNTTAVPMDARRFTTTPMTVDRWEVSRDSLPFLSRQTIDLRAASEQPCSDTASQALGAAARDDCALQDLIEDLFGAPIGDSAATGPPSARVASVRPESDTLTVLFIDLPGEDESSWRRAYRQSYSRRLPRSLEPARTIYAHPFIHRVSAPDVGDEERYEFVMQYWFFYPFNDGGNNHEGDWEHINVVLAFLNDAVAGMSSRLSPEQVKKILHGHAVAESDSRHSDTDRLVIGRVEYYFHHNVQVVDYLFPNAYAIEGCTQTPAQVSNDSIRSLHNGCRDSVVGSLVRSITEERRGERLLWRAMLDRAYPNQDSWEWFFPGVVYQGLAANTHPIGFIGGDNKGFDQLLALPGGKNRDSHGTYPFPGLYKRVGPGAAEQLRQVQEHREDFDAADIELLPDWERVLPLVRTEPRARSEWSWFVLPVRWGFPAVVSPFAGTIANVDLGNLAIFGPAYNTGWNRVGGALGYAPYEPHTYRGRKRLDWQGQIANTLGFINILTASLQVLPPTDLVLDAGRFAWRLTKGTGRTAGVLVGIRRHPGPPAYTFAPLEDIPVRLEGATLGASFAWIPNDFALLMVDSVQVARSVVLDGAGDSDRIVRVLDPSVSTVMMHEVSWNFFVGRRFVSQTQFRFTTMPHWFPLLGGLGILPRPVMRVAVRSASDPVPTADEVAGRAGGTIAEPPRVDRTIEGVFDAYELNASIRVNFATGSFQPYARGALGYSWFHIDSIGPPDEGRTGIRPNLLTASTKVDTHIRAVWTLGFGMEVMVLDSERDWGFSLQGWDLGFHAEIALRTRRLDIKTPFAVAGVPAGHVWWPQLSLGLTVSL